MDASILNTQVGNMDFGTSSGGKVYLHKIVLNGISAKKKNVRNGFVMLYLG